MNRTEINGNDFERMVKNALNLIRINERTINDMNVFPVPDGDTGTNMRLTLENGIAGAKSSGDISAYLRGLSRGMLFGARGNSGVILSQLFKGIYNRLQSESAVNATGLAEALVSAYKVAYGAVVKPAEGTLLTVAREGIENILGSITAKTTIEELFAAYLNSMRESLRRTPDLLPVLREAGVLDSGGYGYIVIIDGMYKYLNGEIISCENGAETVAAAVPDEINYSLFNESSHFEYGYCMEFMLQLLEEKAPVSEFDTDGYISALKSLGESIVAIREDTRVRVHIHTFEPAKVITLSQNYGEFTTFKLENMCLQNQNEQKKKEVHLPYAIISVGNGDGVRELYGSFKNVFYVEGGPTMNTPAKDFVDKFLSVHADRIIVLPNNKNIFRSAEQAVKLAGINNVDIIPTRNLVEGYYALAMNTDDDGNIENRIEEMRTSMRDMITLSVAVATRDWTHGGVSCKKGDYICLAGDELLSAEADAADAISQGLEKLKEVAEKESCVIFKGRDCADELCDAVIELIDEKYDISADVIEGGQETYPLIIGLS